MIEDQRRFHIIADLLEAGNWVTPEDLHRLPRAAAGAMSSQGNVSALIGELSRMSGLCNEADNKATIATRSRT